MDADARTILIDEVVPPSTMQETLAIDERMARTMRKLETDFANVETKIHRFPRSLRRIDGGRYIAPSVVAIGPYHHGAPRLREMEEVKLAAAYHLCRSTGRSTVEVYERVRSVADAARGCYAAADPSVEGVGEADFAAMMFLDGCFLLQYMVGGDNDAPPVLRNRMTLSTGPSIQKDIFLLENQIPWLVLEALMGFMQVPGFMTVDVSRFVQGIATVAKFLPGKPKAKPKNRRPWMPWGRTGGGTEHEYMPPHLLGLLRLIQVGNMPADMVTYAASPRSLSSSAVELAEIGVSLTPSAEPWLGDMRLDRGLFLFGKLYLSPLFLNDVTACWVVNMAAMEASTSGVSSVSDGYVVSSYLSVLAMLMDRDDDVQQLRAKRVVHSTFSNKQTLGFFKGLAQHLRFGGRYFALLEEIESYKRHRAVRIAIHKLLYNSFKAMTIATLFSIVGVLVGIFKTLLDNKKH